MCGGCALYMERTNSAAALDKRQYRVLVCKAATFLHILFLTDEGFINFDDPAAAAQRRKLARPKGFTNAMR